MLPPAAAVKRSLYMWWKEGAPPILNHNMLWLIPHIVHRGPGKETRQVRALARRLAPAAAAASRFCRSRPSSRSKSVSSWKSLYTLAKRR